MLDVLELWTRRTQSRGKAGDMSKFRATSKLPAYFVRLRCEAYDLVTHVRRWFTSVIVCRCRRCEHNCAVHGGAPAASVKSAELNGKITDFILEVLGYFPVEEPGNYLSIL